MSEHFASMIPGATGNGSLEVTAPYDATVLATVAGADGNAVEQALASAHALFRDRKAWLPAAQRIAVLERTAELMQERARELALGAAAEGGKPLSDSQVEVDRAIDGVRQCAQLLRHQAGHAIPMRVNAYSAERLAVTLHEPIGTVVAVSAFNHPLNLIVHQVAPAVAAGCPVVVKPAKDTPLSCLRFVQLLREAGLPETWCQVAVIQDLAVAERMVCDPRVGFFSFIGSAQVGWALRSKLAPGTRCALEHGGVAPLLVEADADLEQLLPLLTKAAFYHAGQVCISAQRVYAHESIVHNLAERLAELATQQRIGDPVLADTEVGPLIRGTELERVEQWVQEAVQQGAQLLCGGRRIEQSCYACTVLMDPTTESQVSCKEIFGPVVCIYPYDDLDEAIVAANDSPYAFQAAIFTRDLDRALHAATRLDASAVMINDHTAFRVDWMPFAGLRQSGLGVGGIPYTMHDMQIEKMLVIRSPALPA